MSEEKQAGSRYVGGPDYRALNETSVVDFLAPLDHLAERLGGSPASWQVREIGDGNLNLVFSVKGEKRGLIVKQALPYVRMVGESWPLPLDRAYFEHEALQIEGLNAPHLVPEIYHFDTMQAAIVMELFEPHIILRKGLIQGIRYPKLAGEIAEFCALNLFATSDLGSPAAEKRERQALFSHNITLAKITEDLVFTDPYRETRMNRWTSPQLDGFALAYRKDAALKIAVQELKWMFISRGEALLHGDLHSGSIMVTPKSTRIIDPEFAVFGPMGFDLGAFMANLLLNFFSQEGHATKEDDRQDYRVYLLDTLSTFWNTFETMMFNRWTNGGDGDVFSWPLFDDRASEAAFEAYRKTRVHRLFNDAIGFAGAEMARRILGLAHVEDLESIADPECRAACEKRALTMARRMMLERNSLSSIKEVRTIAEDLAKAPPPKDPAL
jgi:5-methylthioribose kinase